MTTPKPPRAAKIIVLWSLGFIAALAMTGYIILGAIHSTISTEPLTSIASACIGSLGTFLATEGKEVTPKDPDEQYELIIGRAATKSILAEAMRQMGVGALPHDPSDTPERS